MYWFQEECVCELFCGKPIWQRFHFVDSTGDRISNIISWIVPNRYMHFQRVRNRSKIFDLKFTCYDLCAKKRVRMVCAISKTEFSDNSRTVDDRVPRRTLIIDSLNQITRSRHSRELLTYCSTYPLWLYESMATTCSCGYDRPTAL